MTVQWKIEPLIGLHRILFGMSYDEVVRLCGDPAQQRIIQSTRVARWSDGFLVHFNPAVEFIEVSRIAAVSATLFDLALLELLADDVLQRLVEKGHSYGADTEDGHSFVFDRLQIGLWRATKPADEHDQEGRYFDAVGLGRSGYYK